MKLCHTQCSLSKNLNYKWNRERESILLGCNYLSIKSNKIRLLFTHFILKLKRKFNFNKRLKTKMKIISIVHNLCANADENGRGGGRGGESDRYREESLFVHSWMILHKSHFNVLQF